MLNRIFKSVILGVFALLIVTNLSSCKKEKETIGVIIVKKSNGLVVSGASVKLWPDPVNSPITGALPLVSLTKTELTDGEGRAYFTYDSEIVLNVEITKKEGNDNYHGQNVIRLLKEKTTTKTVEISK